MNYTAIVAAVLSIGTAASVAFGEPALGAVFSDPTTATTFTALIGVIAAAVSAFSQPVHRPAT